MALDYTKVNQTHTPTRWRRMAVHLIEEDPRDWAMLDPTSKTWYQYVYDNVAALVAKAISLALDTAATTELTFTFSLGEGAEVDTYTVYYLAGAAGTEDASTIKSTGSTFGGSVAPAGTTLTGLTSSTQYGIVVETTNEVGSQLSDPLFESTTA